MKSERLEGKQVEFDESITKAAKTIVKVVKMLSQVQNIDKRFNLSEEQMEIFNSAFAMYYAAKKSERMSYLSRRPELEAMQKVPIFNLAANSLVKRAQRNDLIVRYLRLSVENLSASYSFEDKDINPARLVNAANYLSTMYADNPVSFTRRFEESEGRVEKILRD